MAADEFVATVYLLETRAAEPLIKVKVNRSVTADQMVRTVVTQARLVNHRQYELAEIFCSRGGRNKERRLGGAELPCQLAQQWPTGQLVAGAEYRFYLMHKDPELDRSLSWRGVRAKVRGQGSREEASNGETDEFLAPFLSQRQDACSDLCALPDLSERTLLDSLAKRFKHERIYTYVGSILLAVNPFHYLNLYNPVHQQMYQEGQPQDLPPHIFAVADSAYQAMLNTSRDQCIVISGESGSGKTECTNHALHHLAHLSQRLGAEVHSLEETLLCAGPVLEAFGNARTIHNHNSSRFGKFLQINYRKNGTVHGAIVEKYLLEKSRITNQAKNERNYHVFYYLIAGASEDVKESLSLRSLDQFHYLNQEGAEDAVDGVLSSEEERGQYDRLVKHLDIVGFTNDAQRKIFSLLAAVLHLGNVRFQEEFSTKRNYNHAESVTIKNPELITVISHLLGVKEDVLMEALTSKRTVAGPDSVVMMYKYEEAVGTRDAMAKCLYGALFDWIVFQINRSLLNQEDGFHHLGNSIGVLDIFGFEDFEHNGFEQFCINYANEHLQYYFNQHIFKYEQAEYKAEGIDWKLIEFTDNTGCLDLFAKRNVGLFYLLDEERNFPGATNTTLLQKFHSQHRQNPFYEEPMKKEDTFCVKHYAGKVKYHVEDFREKNSDHMRPDIVCVLKNSHFAFVRHLLGSHMNQFKRKTSSHKGLNPSSPRHLSMKRVRISESSLSTSFGESVDAGAGNSSSLSPKSTFIYKNNHKKRSSFKPRKDPFGRKQSRSKMFKDYKELKILQNRKIVGATKSKTPSVSLQFQQSLQSLMETLDKANPYFVRCIRSNTNQSPLVFDEATVLRQLRYTGMLATVRLRQSGYNNRVTLEEFTQQYHALLPAGRHSSRDQVQTFLLKIDNATAVNFQMGKTKVFLRETLKMLLDEALHHALMSSIIKIQRQFRKRQFQRRFKATNILQKHFRGYLARRKYRELRALAGLPSLSKRATGGTLQKKRNRLSRQSRTDDQAVDSGHHGNDSTVSHHGDDPRSISEGRMDTPHAKLYRDESMFERELESTLEELAGDPAVSADSGVKGRGVGLPSPQKPAVPSRGSPKSDTRPTPPHPSTKPRQKSPLSGTPPPGTPKPTPKNTALSLATAVSGDLDTSSSLDTALPGDLRAGSPGSDPSEGLSPRAVPSKGDIVSPRGVVIEVPQTDIDSLLDTEETAGKTSDHSARESPCDHLSPVPEVVSPREDTHTGSKVGLVIHSLFVTRTADGDQMSSASDEGILVRSAEDLPSSFNDQSYSRESGSSGLGLDEGRHVQSHTRALDVDVSGGRMGTSAPTTPTAHRKPKKDAGLARLELSPQFQRQSVLRKGMTGKKSQSVESVTDPRELTAPSGETKRNSAPHTPMDHVQDAEVSTPSSDLEKRSLHKTSSGNSTKTEEKLLSKLKHAIQGKGKARRVDSEGSDDEVTHDRREEQQKLSASDGAELIRRMGSKKRVDKSGSGGTGSPGWASPALATPSSGGSTGAGEWKLLGKAQWHYPDEFSINSKEELYRMDSFVNKHRRKFEEGWGEKKKETVYDRIFKDALREFSNMLRSRMSTFGMDAKEAIKYRDLMASFEGMLDKSIRQEQLDSKRQELDDFSSTLAINAFRGYLDEFRKDSKESTKSKHKAGRRKQPSAKAAQFSKGHKLLPIKAQFSITTFCEVCHKQMLWNLSEKGLQCEYCKFTCHKRCAKNIYKKCKDTHKANAPNAVFGVPLEQLCTAGKSVPLLVDRMIVAIETKGLYTEGVYRKTGAAGKIQELRTAIDTDLQAVDLQTYPIHVLTQVFKNFFKDMPQPLLTFELYDEFIRASDIEDPKEAAQSLRATSEKLPTHNYETFSRLMLHLARVAHNEKVNRMSVNSLAIVFAPSILRGRQYNSAQQTMSLFNKQCRCIDFMLEANVKKFALTMADMDVLETVEQKAFERLDQLRRSIQHQRSKSVEKEKESGEGVALPLTASMKDFSLTGHIIHEEVNLREAQREQRQINSKIELIQKKRHQMLDVLPQFSVHLSSDDDILSDDPDSLEGGSTNQNTGEDIGSLTSSSRHGSVGGEDEEEEEEDYLRPPMTIRSPFIPHGE